MVRQTFVLGSLFIALSLAGCGQEPIGPASPIPDWATAKAATGADTLFASNRIASPAALAAIRSAKPGYRIDLILAPADPSPTQPLVTAFKADAGRLDVKVKVLSPSSATGQIRLLESAVSGDADAVCIVPDPNADLTSDLQHAQERKVPVVAIQDRVPNSVMQKGQNPSFSAQVGADAVTGGRLAGQAFMPLWGHTQAVVLTDPGVGQIRASGFNTAVNGALAVAMIQSVRADGSDSQLHMAELLRRFPNLGALFCTDERIAKGALEAITSAGLRGRIAVVVYGTTPELRARLNSGDLWALIDRHTDRIASDAVRIAVALSTNQFEAGDTIVVEQEIVKR